MNIDHIEKIGEVIDLYGAATAFVLWLGFWISGAMMTVRELIAQLLKLPSSAEIAVNGPAALAAEPEIVVVDSNAYRHGDGIHGGGFKNPNKAYLLRPKKEIV